jgi:hypothetical protein
MAVTWILLGSPFDLASPLEKEHFFPGRAEIPRYKPLTDWAPVILATQEAEIRRIVVQSQPR